MTTRNGKRTIYDEAMQTFHRAADLIGIDPRVRLELEEPDFEHIFYVTIEIHDRLVPLGAEEAQAFRDVHPSSMKAADALEPLANGSFVLHRRALLESDLELRRGVIHIPQRGIFRVEKGGPRRFKAYRIQHNQVRGPYKGGIRFHKDVSLDLFKALAADMTWNTCTRTRRTSAAPSPAFPAARRSRRTTSGDCTRTSSSRPRSARRSPGTSRSGCACASSP